jgi:hypothetical protein
MDINTFQLGLALLKRGWDTQSTGFLVLMNRSRMFQGLWGNIDGDFRSADQKREAVM